MTIIYIKPQIKGQSFSIRTYKKGTALNYYFKEGLTVAPYLQQYIKNLIKT